MSYVFIGEADPGDVSDGSIWHQLDYGVAPGQRAAPGTVGFRGDPDTLIEINYLDDLLPYFPATLAEPFGTAGWDVDAPVIRIYGDDAVVEGFKFNVMVTHGRGYGMTIRNCIINAPVGGLNAIGGPSEASGPITVEDCTIICGSQLGPPLLYYPAAIMGDTGRLIARRNDVSGSGDGIHWCGTICPDGFDDQNCPIIEQNYVHDLAYIHVDQHLDGMQNYTSLPSNTTEETHSIVRHNYIDLESTRSPEPEDAPTNACYIGGQAPGLAGVGPLMHVRFENNYFGDGVAHLRCGYQTAVEIFDNNFDSIKPGEIFFISNETWDGANLPYWTRIDVWDNNRTGSGQAGTGDLFPISTFDALYSSDPVTYSNFGWPDGPGY